MAAIASFHVCLPLTAAYAAASSGCPLARRSRVMSVPSYLFTYKKTYLCVYCRSLLHYFKSCEFFH